MNESGSHIPRKAAISTGLYVLVWGVLFSDATWWNWLSTAIPLPGIRMFVPALYWVVFTGSLAVGALWLRWARSQSSQAVWGVVSAGYVFWWHWLLFVSTQAGLPAVRAVIARLGLAGLFFVGLAWVVWGIERAAEHYRLQRLAARRREEEARAAQHPPSAEGPSAASAVVPVARPQRIWNPLDPHAWYYGRTEGRKLNQSLTALFTYSFAFLLAFTLFHQISGCREVFEMPAGGGEQKTVAQQVKIQKVIKKKFVINPYSSVIFNPPPIDEIKLQLEQATAHLYKVGYGSGDGAGYAGGVKGAKVRFIRLEYSGGDWDQDFGIGADLNMLIQYGVLTGQPVHDQTESRTIGQLANFPPEKSPPFVYLTGQRNISLSQSEIKILREYLLDKHGMIFGDNGGSQHFHNQFFAMMRAVLGPGVEPVKVPLDDVIHRVPFTLPFLPYVARHGGLEAWGWKVDGRWVCYYHPGDIGDAWADDHAGVPREIYEACYQLGANVMNYSYAEYSKWLVARQKK